MVPIYIVILLNMCCALCVRLARTIPIHCRMQIRNGTCCVGYIYFIYGVSMLRTALNLLCTRCALVVVAKHKYMQHTNHEIPSPPIHRYLYRRCMQNGSEKGKFPNKRKMLNVKLSRTAPAKNNKLN